MSPEKRARILLADDHASALAQATRVLGEHWDIAGTAANGVELLAAAARLDPDVIVLDIAMPLMDGFEAARTLRRTGSRSRLVFLTVWDDQDYRAESQRVGADAYVVKSRLASDLVPAVRAALEHQRIAST
jgi:DNA-binding NarL/FixJ family response regulator